MSQIRKSDSRENVLAAILSQENFWPTEPRSFSEAGIPASFAESLICKRLSIVGLSSGRQLARFVCLPFELIESTLKNLRERQMVVHKGSAPLNDYTYALTENGRDRARQDMATCSYIGPAPVPLNDYVVSAEAQTIRAESPKRKQLEAAFKDVSVNRDIFETLGPAVNSGAGLFLYGEPGNGKTTLAKRVIKCFGQQVWIPYAIIDDGQIIKLYDPSLHQAAEEEDALLSDSSHDERWIRVQRPTVVVGGELTLDSLEIRHDPVSNVSEAPLQLKANCGCFLIDDFGRQRVDPAELLNRWIVPLENRIDYLTLATGKKIQVPFEQLIVFSTNLDPSELVDEAFLRRIPYKIFVRDPERKEFHALFRYYSTQFNCEYRPEVIDRLMTKHYFMSGRSLRRCHPRDLLGQIRNYCVYNDIRMEMRDEYFDYVVRSYFADAICDPIPEVAEDAIEEVETNEPSPAAASTVKKTDKEAEVKAEPAKPLSSVPRENATMQLDKKSLAKINSQPADFDLPLESQPETAVAVASPAASVPAQPATNPGEGIDGQPAPAAVKPTQKTQPTAAEPKPVAPKKPTPAAAAPKPVAAAKPAAPPKPAPAKPAADIAPAPVAAAKPAPLMAAKASPVFALNPSAQTQVRSPQQANAAPAPAAASKKPTQQPMVPTATSTDELDKSPSELMDLKNLNY